MSKARFSFNFEDRYMTTQALKSYISSATRDDMSALKSEYTRMRDVAQKRLKRLQKSEFKHAKYIEDRPMGFPKLREMDVADLPYAMNELYRFLHAKTSTVSGQRERMEKTINKFGEHGIEISPTEYPQFIKVMESMRKNKLMYDSEHAKELTETILSRRKVDKRLWTSRKRVNALLANAANLSKLVKRIDEVMEEQGKFLAVNMDAALIEFGWMPKPEEKDKKRKNSRKKRK